MLLQISGGEYLEKLLREATRFTEDIASEMETKVKLVNIGRFCEIIDKSSEISTTLKEFICKQIKAEIEQMKSALEDLESEDSLEANFYFFKAQIEY